MEEYTNIVKVLKSCVLTDRNGKPRKYFQVEINIKNQKGDYRRIMIPDVAFNLYNLKVGSLIFVYQYIRKDGYLGDYKFYVKGTKDYYESRK